MTNDIELQMFSGTSGPRREFHSLPTGPSDWAETFRGAIIKSSK